MAPIWDCCSSLGGRISNRLTGYGLRCPIRAPQRSKAELPEESSVTKLYVEAPYTPARRPSVHVGLQMPMFPLFRSGRALVDTTRLAHLVLFSNVKCASGTSTVMTVAFV